MGRARFDDKRHHGTNSAGLSDNRSARMQCSDAGIRCGQRQYRLARERLERVGVPAVGRRAVSFAATLGAFVSGPVAMVAWRSGGGVGGRRRRRAMARSVRRAKHDMIAYVRFHRRGGAGIPEYLAWYEPEHEVLAYAAEHFAHRMGTSSWWIGTPQGAALWDGATLQLSAVSGDAATIRAGALLEAFTRGTVDTGNDRRRFKRKTEKDVRLEDAD